MTPVSTADRQEPLLDLNTTPLIDVMLVLLVMFIITLPIQTHAVKMDLPQPCANCPIVDAHSNTVSIDTAGGIFWNGSAVSQQELKTLLQRSVQMRPSPELHLQPADEARYGTVDAVLAIIKREHVQRFGFVGNAPRGDIF